MPEENQTSDRWRPMILIILYSIQAQNSGDPLRAKKISIFDHFFDSFVHASKNCVLGVKVCYTEAQLGRRDHADRPATVARFESLCTTRCDSPEAPIADTAAIKSGW